jgi:hypothetical protein
MISYNDRSKHKNQSATYESHYLFDQRLRLTRALYENINSATSGHYTKHLSKYILLAIRLQSTQILIEKTKLVQVRF